MKKPLISEVKVESVHFYELEDLTKEEKDEFLILNIDNTEFLGKEIHIERLDILVSELGKIYLNYWSIK